MTGDGGGVRHLYVHVPFCAHRCGYCDFVTAVDRRDEHATYVAALLHELELRRELLSDELESVYIGGGTPTFLDTELLERLLSGLPGAAELTIEANPETVSAGLAELLATCGVDRVSLGAQSFQHELLAVLERLARPETVYQALERLRAAGLENISLDLIYGVPGQTQDQLLADLATLTVLQPEHVSAYELEAKPGTRFTHAYGAELVSQADELELYMELVTTTLEHAGYRWYETASFCRTKRSRHNLGYWLGHDYLGIGVGAVSTLGELRWQNNAGLGGYLEALGKGALPPAIKESLPAPVRLWERAMLGLRLEEGVEESAVEPVVDQAGLQRMLDGDLVVRVDRRLRLSRRGRALGGAVTAELLTEPVAEATGGTRKGLQAGSTV